ncbi:MAG: O-antigen ligase family protein [Chloroflexota bacterium]
MSAATATREKTGRTASSIESRLPSVLTSEPAILLAMLASLGVYYLIPGLFSAAIGGLAFFALTVYRPALGLAMIPLVAPLFYRQRTINIRDSTLFFSLAEFVIVCNMGAWVLRDGWTFVRTRTLPWRITIPRAAGIWLAVAFAAIGLLWIFVPDIPTSDLRKVALREFRLTVLEPLLFFALMLRWLRTERDIWRMIGAWLIAAALVGREGVEQYLFGQAALMEGVGRATSVYPSATALGIYLGRALPLALVLAVFLPKDRQMWRVASALLAVPIGFGVIVSFARGAWIGVFIALAVVAVIARHKWMLAALGAAVVAGLAALPFIRVERITSVFNFSTEDNTGVARAKIWTAALKIIGDHPLKGIGQDQFLYQDPSYGVPQMRFFTTSHPHNWVLDFWLRLGLPGLVWVLAALGYFFWQGIRLWQRLQGTALGALTLALIASMIDFVVHGLLDMAYFTMDLALTFWLTMGLMVIMAWTTADGRRPTAD